MKKIIRKKDTKEVEQINTRASCWGEREGGGSWSYEVEMAGTADAHSGEIKKTTRELVNASTVSSSVFFGAECDAASERRATGRNKEAAAAVAAPIYPAAPSLCIKSVRGFFSIDFSTANCACHTVQITDMRLHNGGYAFN